MISFKEYLDTLNESNALKIPVREVKVKDSFRKKIESQNKDNKDVIPLLNRLGACVSSMTPPTFYIYIAEECFNKRYNPRDAVENPKKCIDYLCKEWETQISIQENKWKDIQRSSDSYDFLDAVNNIPEKDIYEIKNKTLQARLIPWNDKERDLNKEWNEFLTNLFKTIGTEYNKMIVDELTDRNLRYWINLGYEDLINHMESFVRKASSKFIKELEKLQTK